MIFARRALQRRLDELRTCLPAEVVAAWAARMNKPGRDRMAAMWETVVIHALSKQGDLSVEGTLASGRRPDIAFAGTVSFIADVTSVSDEGLDEANPFSELLAIIEKAKGKLGMPIGGVDLSVDNTEIVNSRGRRRILRLPTRKRLQELVDQRIMPVLRSQMAEGATVLRVVIDEEAVGFTVTIDPVKSPYSSGHYASYTTPTIKDDNPLYKALKAKAKQLRGVEGRSGVIVGDASTASLSGDRVGQTTLSPLAIVQEFMRQHQSVDFVLLLTVREQRAGLWGAAPTVRTIAPTLVARPGIPEAAALKALFEGAVGDMPRPVMSPTNGALRAREAEYDLGHHGAWKMSGLKVSMSARELVEVLAGRRTLADGGTKYVEASRKLGRSDPSRLQQAFERHLSQGRLPSDIRVVKGGEDDNDDWVEFDFDITDPAISPLR